MDTNKSKCVWEHLLPEAEAPAMRLRSYMMRTLVKEIKNWDQTPEETCNKLWITNGRLTDLLSGHIDLFSYDDLFELLKLAGIQVETTIKEGLKS